jgi:hypothetical protein
MRTFLFSLVGALALTLGACKSHDKNNSYADVPCNCGTNEAILDGCAHPLCVSGEGNPDNADCVCAPIEFGEDN